MKTTALMPTVLLALAAAPGLAQPGPGLLVPVPGGPGVPPVPVSEPAPDPAPAVAPTAETGSAPAEAKPATAPGPREYNITPGLLKPKDTSGGNPFKWWAGYIDSELERIDKMDLYGVTSQLPRGYLSVKWDWGMLKARRRYDSDRKLGPIMKPIQLGDTNLDLGLYGSGGGHTFQASYGILGNFDWYIEFPFQYMNIGFHPRMLDAEGKPVPNAEYEGKRYVAEMLPALGRPVPGLNYNAKWALGDINTGFSWNYFRDRRMSAALTCRVFLPTGRLADPNDSLLYGTGPELDVGRGGWAVGFTQGYDLRIFKYSFWVDIVASTEFTAAYAFAQRRKYPTNFTKPTLNAATLQAMGIDPDAFLDFTETGDPETHKKVEGTFSYRPGWSVDWTAQLQVQVALLGLGVAYGVQHSQEPEISGDRRFISMVKGLELLGEQTTHAVQLSASVSLLPVYVPAQIAFQWRKVVDGFNAIVFDDYYQITVKTYIPIFPMEARTFPSAAFPDYRP